MHVCMQLSEPDVNNIQTCLDWAVMQSILPPLSLQESVILGTSFWLVIIVAKGFQILSNFIRKI